MVRLDLGEELAKLLRGRCIRKPVRKRRAPSPTLSSKSTATDEK